MTSLQSCVEYVSITSSSCEVFHLSNKNAYVIHDYLVPQNQPNHRNITFHAFADKLCHDLIGSYRRTSVTRQNSNAS